MHQITTEIEIEVEPYGSNIPIIKFGIDDKCLDIITIDSKHKLKFNDILNKGNHSLFIDFFNKSESDPDTALIINSVTVESMTFDKFKWNSKYYPRYPIKYFEENYEKLERVINSSTYLGWNGVWKFEFETPIFEWIHRLENLGWLYD